MATEEADWEDMDEREEDDEAIDLAAQPAPEGQVYDTPFYHLQVPKAIRHCASCSKAHSKFTCAKCHVVTYCSRECQTVHWIGHKDICTEICRANKAYDKLEKQLHHFSDDPHREPFDYFTDDWTKAHFYGLLETRPYCRSLSRRVQAYRLCRTQEAIKEALLLAMKMLYHCRGDNMGLRDGIPALLCTLSMDQEAHDFMKWYETFPDSHYDWGNPRLPFLHFWGHDRSLPIAFSNFTSLSFLAIDVLIKYRLLRLALEREAFYLLLAEGKRSGRYKTDVMRVVHSYLDHSQQLKVINRRPDRLLQVLQTAMDRAETNNNARIWRAIVNPAPLLRQDSPSHYSKGSAEEMYFSLEACAFVFAETDGAMAFLKSYCVAKHGGVDYDSKLSSGFPGR